MERKKICFITVRNIYQISCLPRYIKCFRGNPFDIIYWDRANIEENCGAENHYAMRYKTSNRDSKWKKLLGYIKFMRFANNILNKNKYDAIILLPTQTGILLHNLMTKKYAGKYILDIRDYSAENNKLFYYIEKKLIKNSGLTVITSPAFERFLPKYKYYISHNTTHISCNTIREYRNRTKAVGKQLVISCIGSIRFYDQFKKILSCFSNDKRYLLRFIGNGSEGLQDYCKQNKIENIQLVGRFSPDKTIDYYMNTDIVLNLYGNHTPFLDYALSNKLYYAATLGMPILVCPGTYMQEVSVEGGFGFTFNIEDETMRDKLYEYYNTIDWPLFYDNCDVFMKKTNNENAHLENTLKKFIKDSLNA